MILVSTHAKMSPNTPIFRADIPACRCQDVEIPAHSQHFATRKQAEKFVESYNYPFSKPGKVTAVLASEFNPWLQS